MGKTSKDKRDIFYRLAKQQGWRARSAFKLLQAHETFQLLDGVTRAVDLCAAPGGWSQVLARHMYEPKTPEEREHVKIIAVDMQGMAPIDGVSQLRADITKESTATEIIDFFGGKKAQLVVSDGAPDVTGLHDWDAYMQAQLLLSALSIATYVLEEGGSFMGKVYRAANTTEVYVQLKRFFKDAVVFKPSACRNSSIEAFVVCRQFCMPEGHIPCNLISEWLKKPQEAVEKITGKRDYPVVKLPFVAHQCEYDSDLSYKLDDEYDYKEPVQQPLTAAYQEVLEQARKINLKYGSYKVVHDEELHSKQRVYNFKENVETAQTQMESDEEDQSEKTENLEETASTSQAGLGSKLHESNTNEQSSHIEERLATVDLKQSDPSCQYDILEQEGTETETSLSDKSLEAKESDKNNQPEL